MDVNVKVAVRCRPMSLKELNRDCQSIVTGNSKSIHIENIHDPNHAGRDFTFDYCYYHDCTQDQVYKDLGQPVVVQALEGFNGTIFAYGQTGSGKSFSMMGSAEDPGIIPRLNDDLWSRIAVSQEQDPKVTYLITASFLEIYNEEITDLLFRSDKHLKIRESPDKGIYVEGLCELVVKDAGDLLRLIDQGNTVRRVAATNMNDTSSRSHSCFLIKIERKTTTELAGGVTRVLLNKAKVNLVDLAGSERSSKTGATGQTLREGIGINSSLTALGNVINALSEGSKHIPYRDSKLTRLLQESLGGNAATVMIAAISPADYNHDETLSTLKYANRAKSIANTVTRNEDLTERALRDLKEQVEALKSQLAKAASAGSTAVEAELQERLKAIQAQQQSEWEEKEKLSRLLEEERQRNMNAVVGDMMEKVKEQKRTRIKHINSLTAEKTDLAKKFKIDKETNAKLTAAINKKTMMYQQLQQEYELNAPLHTEAISNNQHLLAASLQIKLEAATEQMTDLVEQVEKDRVIWQDQRVALEQLRSRLAEISDEIIDEKAELVTFAGLLDQNDKLRSKIQDEERAKAKDVLAEELMKARQQLEAEQAQVRDSLENEIANKTSMLTYQLEEARNELLEEKKKNAALTEELREQWEFCSNLEKQLVVATQQKQEAEAEASRIMSEFQSANGMQSSRASTKSPSYRIHQLEEQLMNIQIQHEEDKRLSIEVALHDLRHSYSLEISKLKADFDENRFFVFKSMMDGFTEERSALMSQIDALKGLLQQATKDVVYLSNKNDELKTMLGQALTWEPTIQH